MAENRVEGVDSLIGRLEESMRAALASFQGAHDEVIDQPCSHGCAHGGTAWNLVTHNIEHERQHAGQVVGIRDRLHRLQQDRRQRLIAELYVERARLVATLFGLRDGELDQVPAGGGWTVRQVIEHLLSQDRSSRDDMQVEHQAPTAQAD